MPVYLFTYHGHYTWSADRSSGYVRRGEGILPPDEDTADLYNRQAKHDPTYFDDDIQQHLIDAVLTACEYQNLRLHAAATEPTHIHILVSWDYERDWKIVRAKVRESLTRHLNKVYPERKKRNRPWFSRGGSRKRVRDRDHFNYLLW